MCGRLELDWICGFTKRFVNNIAYNIGYAFLCVHSVAAKSIPNRVRVCQKLDLAFASVHIEAIQKLTSLGLHVYKLYILGIIIIKVAGSKAYSYIVDPIKVEGLQIAFMFSMCTLA